MTKGNKSSFNRGDGLKLPDYTDTEILMDDLTLSPTEFMSKVDEISIDEAEDDICFNAKDAFDSSPFEHPIGGRPREFNFGIPRYKLKMTSN